MLTAATGVTGRLLVVALLLSLAGCEPKPRDSRIQGDDLDVMATKMAASLASSSFLRDRSATSPPVVISIQKVENLTDTVMSDGEQWGVIAKLRGSLPIQELQEQRNITFVMPRERVEALKRGGNTKMDFGPDFGATRAPTHIMTATFRNLLRAGEQSETRAYYCEFEILGLDGQRVWGDKFEYKRNAFGHLWD